MSYFHYKLFKEYKQLKLKIAFVDYDKLIRNERKELEELFEHLKIGIVKDINMKETFCGLSHRMDFYEVMRKKSIEDIKAENVKLGLMTESKELNLVYEKLQRQYKGRINITKFITEILELTEYEVKFVRRSLSWASTKEYYKKVIEILNDRGKGYNMKHGYYIFKWSTPRSWIKVSNYLMVMSAGNTVTSVLFRGIRIAVYSIALPISNLGMLFCLLKKRYYQIALLTLLD